MNTVDSDTRIGYISAALASFVSWWSSSGKEWTGGYRFDASCATLLFSRTTCLAINKKLKNNLYQVNCQDRAPGHTPQPRGKGLCSVSLYRASVGVQERSGAV